MRGARIAAFLSAAVVLTCLLVPGGHSIAFGAQPGAARAVTASGTPYAIVLTVPESMSHVAGGHVDLRGVLTGPSDVASKTIGLQCYSSREATWSEVYRTAVTNGSGSFTFSVMAVGPGYYRAVLSEDLTVRSPSAWISPRPELSKLHVLRKLTGRRIVVAGDITLYSGDSITVFLNVERREHGRWRHTVTKRVKVRWHAPDPNDMRPSFSLCKSYRLRATIWLGKRGEWRVRALTRRNADYAAGAGPYKYFRLK
jgi:hypothetical protein